MRSNGRMLVARGMLAAGLIAIAATAMADDQRAKPMSNNSQPSSRADADKMLRTWPAGPQLAGAEMMAKYGPPQEVTSERMIWRDAGPFKRITLTKEMLPHDFPIPHMDYLEHTISYNVPADKTDEVHAFDASISIYLVGGELSARCDLESNNVLTFNLAKDVITGTKSVPVARKAFGDLIMQRALGKNPPYTASLQFKPQQPTVAAHVEKTSIPGAPQRVDGAAVADDGEILGMLVALDNDEIHAASVASMKKVPAPVLAYAKMLHEHHGQHMKETGDLGQKAGVKAQQTPAVRALHDKNAGALAKIVPMEGAAFASAYLDLMVTGHAEALQMIDQQMQRAKSAAVKAHLTKTRATLDGHLQEATKLQADNRQPPQTSSR